MDVNKKVGDTIRKYRQLAGLKQEDAAEEIGMSGGNLGKIERGEIDINELKISHDSLLKSYTDNSNALENINLIKKNNYI